MQKRFSKEQKIYVNVGSPEAVSLVIFSPKVCSLLCVNSWPYQIEGTDPVLNLTEYFYY